MNIDNRAFTLAELVVTITIIAILSTIGFVSYSYVISDSRNSQIKSEMSQLSKLFELWKTKWVDMYSFVLEENENTLNQPIIAWTTTNTNLYKAWKINYVALDYKNKDNTDYRIWVTKKLNNKYQFSASIEDSSKWKIALVKWNYNPRTKSWTLSKIDSFVNNKNIILEKNNWIKVWDTVITVWWTSYTVEVKKINSINNQNDSIYLNNSIDNLTTHISLANDETSWLIMWKDINSNTGVVIDLWNILPY